jgi:uracil-DNA glycosylase family 4
MRKSDCTLCKLSSGVHSVCVWGRGKGKILLLGEAPGEQEDQQGIPFVGKAGKLLDTLLQQLNLTDQVYITNVCKCRPPLNRIPKLEEIRSCSVYLQEEMKKLKPHTIVAMGSTAIRALTGERSVVVGKKRQLKHWYYEYPGGKARVIATYHPAAVLRDPKYLEPMASDFERIFQEDGEEEKVFVKKDWFDTFKSKDPVGFDLETTGIDPFKEGQILLAGWSRDGKTGSYSTRLGEVVRHLNRKLVGHNLKFDLLWLRCKMGYRHLGLVEDSMILMHLVNENLPAFNLKYLAQTFTPLGAYGTDVVHSFESKEPVPEERLGVYCATDAAASMLLRNKAKDLEPRLVAYIGEVLKTLVEVEYRGVLINQKLAEEMQEANRQEQIKIVKEVTEQWPVIQNLSSRQQIARVLHTSMKLPVLAKTKTGQPSTDEDVLMAYSRYPRAADLCTYILRYRSLTKLNSTYIKGILDHCDAQGVVHANFNQTRTVTGRLSCSQPNLQNIPRGSEIKRLFVARPGSVLIQADYSQIELRVGAHLSQDSAMLETIRNGADLHTSMAAKIFGHEPSKEERTTAKTINFGIFYGAGASRIADEAGIDKREARTLIQAWFAAFPNVKYWMGQVEKELLENGQLTNLFGRVRHLPLIVGTDRGEYLHMLRQACNFPVQSVAADLTNMAMVRVQAAVEKEGASVVLNIHDAIVVECPKRKEKKVVGLMQSIMQDTSKLAQSFGYDLRMKVPTPVEIKIGLNWSMEE